MKVKDITKEVEEKQTFSKGMILKKLNKQKNKPTQQDIIQYIKTYFPELLFWSGGKEKWEFFKEGKNYKHRQIMPNEVVIEFDYPHEDPRNWYATNDTCIKLEELGYTYTVYYVEKGRSPHIHIYGIDELENLTQEQRRIYRLRWIRKIVPEEYEPDLGLADEKHMITLEFSQHFKYFNTKKILLHSFNGMNQGGDYDVIKSVTEQKKGKNKTKTRVKKRKLKLGEQLSMKPFDIIKTKLTFEEIFEKYKVEHRGKMALCPFHADKDKSLSFDNEKGLWNCFGCRKKGNIIHLIKFLEERKDDSKHTNKL